MWDLQAEWREKSSTHHAHTTAANSIIVRPAASCGLLYQYMTAE